MAQSRADLQQIGKKKTDHGSTAFFSKGGSMAKPNPFAKFEKSGKDKEPKGMKEGSKKEEAFDKKQMNFAKGGSVGNPGGRDGAASRGKTKGRVVVMKKGGKC